jgi:diguanylate cyclase (GGDEF)-like protein
MATTVEHELNKTGKNSGITTFLRRCDEVIRRLIDIFVSAMALFFLSPFFVVIAIILRRDSPGPILFKGDRVGKNGKLFKILKFRTMNETAQSYKGAKITGTDDPRITPFGKQLRDTKINELPQLWNVLIGDMSLVGPRPEDPEIVKTWPKESRDEILSVSPGITSPASILYRHEETLLNSRNLMDRYLWDILPSKLRLDHLYVRNRSVLTDLDVIFWTAIALLPRLKNLNIPENLLLRGPFNLFVNRYFIWFALDYLVALASIAFAGVLRRLSSPLDIGVDTSLVLALLIALIFSAVNALMGINKIDWNRAQATDVTDLGVSAVVVTIILFFGDLIAPEELALPPEVLVLTGMFAFAGFVLVRYRGRLVTAVAGRWLGARSGQIDRLGEPVLIVGAGEGASFGIWLLRNSPLTKAFNIIGLVDDDPRNLGNQVNGTIVIGRFSDIPDLIRKYDVGLILFAITDAVPEEIERVQGYCTIPSSRIIMIPDVMDSLQAHFPTNEREREERLRKVAQNSTIDRLTGMLNFPAFVRSSDREIQRSRRYQHPCSLILIKVAYCWPEGADRSRLIKAQALKTVAQRTHANLREIDLLGRHGDDSFVVMLPETDLESANRVAQRLYKNLTFSPVMTDRGALAVEAELTIVSPDEDIHSSRELIQRAESYLENSPLGI